MGCDIHGPQIEVFYLGRWWVYAQFHLWRDYVLFAALASVRTREDRPGMFAPRGFPVDDPDLAMVTECEREGGHSASWLTLAEVGSVVRSTCTKDILIIYDVMRSVADLRGWETRLVFWFDN